MADTVLELAGMLKDGDELQRRLNDYQKAKSEAETAIATLDQKKADTASFLAAAEEKVKGHKIQLATAQKQHDTAAAEAKRRIELATGQEKMLLDRKNALDQKETTLNERERRLALAVVAVDNFKAAIQ
jgi:chromosome segregation ATPase